MARRREFACAANAARPVARPAETAGLRLRRPLTSPSAIAQPLIPLRPAPASETVAADGIRSALRRRLAVARKALKGYKRPVGVSCRLGRLVVPEAAVEGAILRAS